MKKSILTSLIVMLFAMTSIAQWNSMSLPMESNCIYFKNASIGYAVCDYGVIYKTTDAGINWTSCTSGTSNNLNSITSDNNGVLYIVGNSGTILKSTNGTTWVSQTCPTTNHLNSICFKSSNNNGYIVGSLGTLLLNSGTTTWTIKGSVPAITTTFNSVCVNNNYVYMSGDNNVVYRYGFTYNSWDEFPIAVADGFKSICFSDVNTIFAVGTFGQIYKINIANMSSTRQATGLTTKTLNSVYFINSTKGYAVGDNGTILKTTDGTNWVIENSGTTNKLNTICFTTCDGLIGYTAGSYGTLLQNFEVVSKPESDFASSNNIGIAPLTTSFYDNAITSTCTSIVKRVWDFGDGEKDSVNANPVHIYDSIGTFTVTLTVTNNSGGIDTMIKIGYVTVGSSSVSSYDDLNKTQVYPNPTTGLITIEGNDINKVEVLDINGKMIMTVNDYTNKLQIDLSVYPKGVYFVRLQNDNEIKTKKVVLQ